MKMQIAAGERKHFRAEMREIVAFAGNFADRFDVHMFRRIAFCDQQITHLLRVASVRCTHHHFQIACATQIGAEMQQNIGIIPEAMIAS